MYPPNENETRQQFLQTLQARLEQNLQSLPLRHLFKLPEREVIRRATAEYRERCAKANQTYAEPSDLSKVCPVKRRLARDVSLVSTDGTVLAVYRVSLTTVREIFLPVPEPAPKKQRPTSVVRLSFTLKERLDAAKPQGQTIHEFSEQLLSNALDEAEAAPVSVLERWKQPLRRLGLVA
jgi:hypothetical protein